MAIISSVELHLGNVSIPADSSDHWLALTSTGTALTFYADGSLIESATWSMWKFAGFSLSDMFGLNDASLAKSLNVDIRRERMWSQVLSLSELVAEAASSTPVISSGLLSNVGLTGTSDLSDSVASRDYSLGGSPSTASGYVRLDNFADNVQRSASFLDASESFTVLFHVKLSGSAGSEFHDLRLIGNGLDFDPPYIWFGNTALGSLDFYVLIYLPASETPVEYEDPCGITEPRIYTTITSAVDPIGTVKFGTHPLRDGSALGGFAEPRLLDVSSVTKTASDPTTGAWSPQTATTRFADTDRANRVRTETRGGYGNCTQEIYLTSNAQSLAVGPPRVIFSGIVNADRCDDGMVWTTEINDLVGNDYSLFAEEKQIPQRTIGVAHFPNASRDALNRAEPVLMGSLVPRNPANGEGVVDGITVGVVALNGTRNTPGAGDVTALVADMQASATAGTLDADFGSRLGHGDCQAYEGGTIPTTEAGLKAAFGTGDIDAILSDYALTGSSDFLCVVVAGHAVTSIEDGSNGDPSVWINDTQLDPAELGTSWWAPQIAGDTTWASTFSSDQFTDIEGSDGTTRRYTLIAFDPASDYGVQVAGGARVHLDCIGAEDVGDGTGNAITDLYLQYRHVLINFLLQNYLTGAWLSVPQFLFSDGSTLIDRVNEESFDDVSALRALYVSGGIVGGFKLGDRTSIRDVIAQLNLSGACMLAQDDYGRLFVRALDRRRTLFVNGHRTLRDKVDFLPGFRIEPKPEWQVNRLFSQYARNYTQGVYERGEGGGGVTPLEDTDGQARDGVITRTIQIPCVRDDISATAIAYYYVSTFAQLPRVVSYARRGLCGLEDDILDGVPITHYNGYGADGWEDHAVWILSKTFDAKRMYCSFTALDVEHLMT